LWRHKRHKPPNRSPFVSNIGGMTHQLFILTGASRGMGLALAEQLLAPDT
jgi:hypothetical protein